MKKSPQHRPWCRMEARPLRFTPLSHWSLQQNSSSSYNFHTAQGTTHACQVSEEETLLTGLRGLLFPALQKKPTKPPPPCKGCCCDRDRWPPDIGLEPRSVSCQRPDIPRSKTPERDARSLVLDTPAQSFETSRVQAFGHCARPSTGSRVTQWPFQKRWQRPPVFDNRWGPPCLNTTVNRLLTGRTVRMEATPWRGEAPMTKRA